MANLCDTILIKDIEFNCDELVTKGLESDGIIINREDVDFGSCVKDPTNPNIIKTLALKDGQKGYSVKQAGQTPFNGTKTSLATGTFLNTFTHEIQIAVLANNPEVSKRIIDGIANGTFLVILRNKAKGENGNAEFQIYGYYQGLKATAIENDKYSDDTLGGWLITLQETGALDSALFFFDTNSSTTLQKYESLLET